MYDQAVSCKLFFLSYNAIYVYVSLFILSLESKYNSQNKCVRIYSINLNVKHNKEMNAKFLEKSKWYKL